MPPDSACSAAEKLCLYFQISSWLPSSQPPFLSFYLELKNLRKEKDDCRSARFWETWNNLASGEHIFWPLSLGRHVHLLSAEEECPLSFPSQCLFLGLTAWAHAQSPIGWQVLGSGEEKFKIRLLKIRASRRISCLTLMYPRGLWPMLYWAHRNMLLRQKWQNISFLAFLETCDSCPWEVRASCKQERFDWRGKGLFVCSIWTCSLLPVPLVDFWSPRGIGAMARKPTLCRLSMTHKSWVGPGRVRRKRKEVY